MVCTRTRNTACACMRCILVLVRYSCRLARSQDTAHTLVGADLAVLKLASPVPASEVTPTARYAGTSEVGSTFTLIGWGNYGPAGPSPPTCEESGGCEQLRAGQNVFDAIKGNVLEYSLTSPDDDSALALEAVAWGGDSGGPAFLSEGGVDYLVGVNSGGKCCSYGDTDQYVRVASTLSREWIDETIAADAALPIADCTPWAGAGEAGDDDELPLRPIIIGAVVGVFGLAGLAYAGWRYVHKKAVPAASATVAA